MDLNKNYYSILGVHKESSEKEIKKAYYKLSFTLHPDKGGDAILFAEITEAYDCLCSEDKTEYDKRSKFGKNYDEIYELLDYKFDSIKEEWDESKYKDWKKDNELNIVVKVDENFNGSLTYQRYLSCKSCGGSGKDLKSKIVIRDDEGNILKIFDGDDGCDFCNGTGKNPFGEDCGICGGKGKVGSENCSQCHGEKRIYGNQTINGIKFDKGEKSKKIDFMGNVSKDNKGMVGHLWIILSS